MTRTGHHESTPRHPIRVVTARTGLSPELLRVWERRYQVVTPSRGPGGQRLYSDADITRLSQVYRATQGGRSIGQVAALDAELLTTLISEDGERQVAPGSDRVRIIAAAFHAIESQDEFVLDAVLRRALLSVGAAAFLEDIIAPLMVRVGDAWHAGTVSIAQEHMASMIVDRQLDRLLLELSPAEDAPVVLIATPSGERHALGALLAASAAAHDEWRPVWLGPDLPATDIAAAAIHHHARVVALSVIAPQDNSAAAREVAELRGLLPSSVPILLGGAAVSRLGKLPAGVTAIRDLSHWRSLLAHNAPAGHAKHPPLSRAKP